MHGRRGGVRSDRYTSDDQNGHTASKIWINISTLQYINQNWSFTSSLLPQEYRKKHKDARRKLKSTQKSWGLRERSLRDSFYSHWFEETDGLFLPHGVTLCVRLVVTNRQRHQRRVQHHRRVRFILYSSKCSEVFCDQSFLHLVWVSHKLPWKQCCICGHSAASVNHSFRGPNLSLKIDK